MMIDDFLERLDGVRRSGRGWRARCPGHDDRTPSFDVKSGDNGILIKCWAGCTPEHVCESMGLTMRDLFYDDGVPVAEIKHRQRTRQRQQQRQRIEANAHACRIDTVREAERLLDSAKGIDTSNWTPERWDEELKPIWQALEIVLSEQRGFDHAEL